MILRRVPAWTARAAAILIVAACGASAVRAGAAATTSVATSGKSAATSRPAGTVAKKPAATRHTAATAAAPKLPRLTVDSLQVEDRKNYRLAAIDANALGRLHRDVDYCVNQFRRFVGVHPPKLAIAAIGNLPDPSRLEPAALRMAGYDQVVTDWPEPAARAGTPRAPAVPLGVFSERASRWFLAAYEREKGRGSPPPGRSRIIPDWYESAIAGLASMPAEQNRRVEWMRAHLDEHVPVDQLLDATRPAKPELFDAQSLAFAKFLVDREGERFLGLWLEVLLSGQPQSAAFNIATTLMADPQSLEKAWLEWMKGTAKAQ